MLATVGVLAVGIAASSRLLRELPLTPPLLGLVVGVLIGPAVLGAAELPPVEHQSAMETASQLLLAVALMGIALRYPARELRTHRGTVTLLLLVAMPAMAAAVAGLGSALLGLSVATAIALGAALAPTDPVLATSVVTGEPAERDIPARLREVLSVESGANDGLALPLALVGVALVGGTSVGGEFAQGLLEVVWGAALGAAMGLGAGALLHAAEQRRDIEPTAITFYALVLAAAVLGTVAVLGGNEILAVFVAGLVFNHAVTSSERVMEAEVDEGLNQFLVVPVFVLFGVVLPWEGWLELGGSGVLFAVAVLVLRRLPWILLLARPLGLELRDAVWLGWFGPIGVAAIFYLGFLHAEGVTDPMVWEAGTLAITASTLMHGVTAVVGRRRYARAQERAHEHGRPDSRAAE